MPGKISIRQREIDQKVRRPTFDAWLLMQAARCDRVGDFASDAVQDGEKPRGAHRNRWIKYLDGKGVKECVIEALKRAWAEYVAGFHPNR